MPRGVGAMDPRKTASSVDPHVLGPRGGGLGAEEVSTGSQEQGASKRRVASPGAAPTPVGHLSRVRLNRPAKSTEMHAGEILGGPPVSKFPSQQ
jgi:hypothetical protein